MDQIRYNLIKLQLFLQNYIHSLIRGHSYNNFHSKLNCQLILNWFMKRSKKSRSKNASPNNSTRKQFQPSSVRGLVTSRQKSMGTQSQVSGYTQKTQKTNTFASSQDFETVDDQIQKQQIREVFVSEEEEKVIQKILQVARKGKINQKNAFQIPIKVLDDQKFTIGKAKFWKFASELLGASMHIYQKRIENTWINTNLIHDKLARMTIGKNKNDQQQQQRGERMRRSQSSQFFNIPIEQFRDPKILDNIRLGEQTLETAAKINIPSFKRQLTNDPLFNRKIKAFDNTSLKGLLLNVFDLDSSCQIQLFCTQSKLLRKKSDKMIKNQFSMPKFDEYINKNIQESKKINQKQESFFNSITQFKKINITKNNTEQGPYDTIGFLKSQTNKEDKAIQQLQKFLTEPMQIMESQMPLFDDYLNNPDSNEIIKLISEDTKTIQSQFALQSQDTFTQQSQNSDYNSLKFDSNGPFSYNSDLDKSFHSVMTPWELEFKEGNLRKKSTKKRGKKQGKKRQKIQPGLVQFDPLHVQNRKATLIKKKQIQTKNTKKTVNYQNLIPPQLAVYQKINFKKAIRTHRKLDKEINQMNQHLPDFLAPDPSMMHQNLQQLNDATILTPNKLNFNQNLASQQQQILILSNNKNHQTASKKFNIRQTKKALYQKAKDQRQLKISEVDLPGVSPASILITFLHIANEKSMIVRNTSGQDDVILSWE